MPTVPRPSAPHRSRRETDPGRHCTRITLASLLNVFATTISSRPSWSRSASSMSRQPVPAPKQFARQIAHNVVPLCKTFTDNGYSTEEMKLLNEMRKILDDPALAVTMTV